MATLTANGSKGHHKFTLNVIEDSTSSNDSYLSFKFILSSVQKSWNWSSMGSKISYVVYINDSSYAGKIPAYDGKSEVVLKTDSNIKVPHNDDGTKTINISFKVTDKTSYNYTSGNASNNGTMELTTIKRASQPSIITFPNTTPDIGYLGDTVTIYMNRQSSSFTHKIRYNWKGKEQEIVNGITDSYDWIIPKSFANDIPNETSGYGTIIVDTYNGNELIGTKSVDFNVKIPDTVEFNPSISKIELTELVNKPNNFDKFIQNVSRIKGVVSAAGSYGSSITYLIKINNESFTSSTFETSIISSSNLKLIVEVKDSRKRVTTYTEIIDVLQYMSPTINLYNAYRDSLDPSKINISFNCDLFLLENKNTKLFEFYYKKVEENEYKQVEIDSSKLVEQRDNGKATYSANYSIIESDTNSSYDTKIVVTDSFFAITSIGSMVKTIFKLMNISSDKKNFAIGKLHEKQGFNEKAIPEIYYDNIYRCDGDYEGVVLSCPSIKNGKLSFNETNNTLDLVINDETYSISLIKK